MKSRGPGTRLYLAVYGALLVLLLATWGVSKLHLGAFNAVAAMTIAVVKMLLIMLFFMHVRYRSRITWIFAGAGFLWLVILFGLTMSDYLTRG